MGRAVKRRLCQQNRISGKAKERGYMELRRGHGYLYGTMVLAVGTVIVKLIGVFFKIPLTNILGGVGMSYFNVAYELYYPLYALFV